MNLLLLRLWKHLDSRRRFQFKLTILLMFFASFAEVASVGLALPFLGVLTSPEKVFENEFLLPLYTYFQILNPSQLILPITILFITTVLIAGVIRLALLYVLQRLSSLTGADLGLKMFRKTIYQDYAVHIDRNSSEVISGVVRKTDVVVGNVIAPCLTIVSSAILLIGVMIALFAIDPFVASFASLGFSFFYLLIIKYTKVKLLKNSETMAIESTNVIKVLQESLGGIRDILLDGSQKFYSKLYRKSDLPLRIASANNQIISGSPRYIMEALGMTLIAILAYIMVVRDGGVENSIPVLGALAIGAQRVLPLLQQSYQSFSTIRGSKASFNDVLDLLDQKITHNNDENSSEQLLPFTQKIHLDNVSFSYKKKSPIVLQGINLEIKKSSCVGFIGKTGSGKSTLIDIIMALIEPVEGLIKIDDKIIDKENCRQWQRQIAHVPQSIYLADSSIKENIAFGVPKEEINFELVKEVAKKANISELINHWPEKYETKIGEHGVKLSGGQRQRIGIARALYKKAEVLILDEATSALDNITEKEVMQTVQSLSSKLTILIIAHRLTTLEYCDQIVELDNGQILRSGTYKEIIG